MLLAEHARLAPLNVEIWSPRAGVIKATLAHYVNHAVFCMLLATDRHFASSDVIVRVLVAEVMCATLADDINHAVLGMLLAVRCFLAAFHVEGR